MADHERLADRMAAASERVRAERMKGLPPGRWLERHEDWD